MGGAKLENIAQKKAELLLRFALPSA